MANHAPEQEKRSKVISVKEIGHSSRESDALMIANMMLKPTGMLGKYYFLVGEERWTLYNEHEFKMLLAELKIKKHSFQLSKSAKA